MIVQINHLLFNCYLKNKNWRPLCVPVSQISRVEPLNKHSSSHPVKPLTQRWRQGSCGVHFGSLERDWATAVTHWLSKPPSGIRPNNLGYPCHHAWTGTRRSTMTANTGATANEKTIFKALNPGVRWRLELFIWALLWQGSRSGLLLQYWYGINCSSSPKQALDSSNGMELKWCVKYDNEYDSS